MFLCTTYLAPSGLAVGFSMSPPILDGPQDDLVIPVHGMLNITCRYGPAALRAKTDLFASVELTQRPFSSVLSDFIVKMWFSSSY